MFTTKHEVDRHVENCLKKINSEQERNLRCFAFAKLYCKVGDYEQAHRYILNYLNAKQASSEGQHLLGKILERLGRKEAALEAYRTSLDLDPKQNKLVIKVCELLASDDVNLDKSWARYFCEKALSFDPCNPVVFQLKEKLVASESKDPYEVTSLLLKELETRPLNVDIRVRLLRHLLLHKKVKEAYEHVYEIEQKNAVEFMNNLNWYETIAEVLMCYQKEVSNNLSWEFWMLFVSVLDKLSMLSMDERSAGVKNGTVCTNAVFHFDQGLKEASENLKSCPEKHLVQEFLNHYTGQLSLHFITLLYRQAKKDLIKYKEVGQICLPLLFAGYNFKPIDLHSMWVEHCSDNHRQLVQRWHREASFRCSQIGHMLLSTAKDKKSSTLDKANQSITGMWREQVFKKVFVTRGNQSKIQTSYFCSCPQLVDFNIALPDYSELTKFDNTAQLVFPDSLHHYIWLGLNSKLSLLNCSVFQGLQYSIKNLNHCAAETLNILDIEAFIYCATLCAKSQIEENKQTIYYNTEKPNIVPAAVTEHLGTAQQHKWLQAAYKLYRNQQSGDMGDVRLTLVRGIECIHCVGNHGLDVKLLVALAKIFEEKSKKLVKQSEIEFTETRAELYWKTALPLLEKLKKNQAISYSTNRLFEFKSKEMSHNEILQNIDSGKLFIASQLMKKKEHEKALGLFEVLKDPYASFNQAQIYKIMADKELGQNKENVTSEMRSQHIILLTKARDCLYLTLDRLRDPNVDRKHPLNEKLGTEIEKIERLLSRIDPDICVNRNECDGMSDENVSSIESENYNVNSTYHSCYNNGNINMNFTRQDNHNLHSTPYRLEHSRREARPSPERLDAQLRQLAASKDSAINHVLEQNKIMVESHKCLVEELKNFRETVSGLVQSVNTIKDVKQSLEEVKGIKKSVDELKVAVDELQGFRNITDMFYEMRKEIAELKKDTTKIKSNQLSDEDLYALDEEYGAEYNNINSNVAGLTPTIYPNLNRLPPGANSLAYAPPTLYHGMYPMYPYAGLGLPPQAGLPFGPEAQLTDFRSMSSLTHGLNQPGLPQGYQQPIPAVQQPSSLVMTSLPQTTFSPSPLAQLQQHTMSNFFKDTVTTVATPSTSNIFATTTSSTSLLSATTTTPTSKALPGNVVITNSDPLPSSNAITTTPQILSVTIPPKHLKGNLQKAHNYQIPLPQNTPAISTTPSVLNQSPMPISTQSLLQNVAPPVYSAIADTKTNKNTSLGLQIEKSLSQSFNKSTNSDLNVSNLSCTSADEHDPCPDFKPIIPLPDEVPVNTGEEKEDVLFCERAKLYRFVNKEWKERGVGDLKILRNPESGKVRILMRRDQVHKICANHYITEDMVINPMNKNEKAYIWAANDFADQEMVLEKFSVQFKTPELAKKFYEEFEKARKSLSVKDNKVNKEAKLKDNKDTKTVKENKETKTVKDNKESLIVKDNKESKSPVVSTANLGGFKFISTPTFKPKEETLTPVKTAVQADAVKSSSPFASFSFTKDSTKADDKTPSQGFPTFSFTSTTENKTPVFGSLTPKTESNENKSMFGVLTPKAQIDTNENKTIFGALTPKTQPENKSFTSLSVSKVETPKPESVVVKPSPVNKSGQENLNESAEEFVPTAEFKPVIPLPDLIDVKTGEENAEVLFESKAKLLRFDSTSKEWKERGIGKMKILKQNTIRLLMRREQVHKVCCNHQLLKAIEFSKMKQHVNAITWYAKDFSEEVLVNELFAIRFKTEEIANSFLDAIKKAKDMLDESDNVKCSEAGSEKKLKPVATPTKPSKVDKFKLTWECKNCFIPNEQKNSYCEACDSPRNENVQKNQDSSQFCFGVNQKQNSASFTFAATKETKGFGDAFKPKQGSWECQGCLIRNDGDKTKCVSCETPKDGSQPAETTKSSIKGVDLSTGGLTFNFGIQAQKSPATQVPSKDEKVDSTFGNQKPEVSSTTTGFGDAFKPKSGSWECKECYSRNEGDYCLACECPKDDTIPVKENKSKGIDLSTGGLSFNFGMPAAKPFSFSTTENKPFSFSLNPTPATAPTKTDENEYVFGSPHKVGFEFTPRSPRRQSGGQAPEEESENSYYEEEEDNIYFKPVIPLPDKVEVTTGEEEEEQLYCHRAKLFRHIEGEWKERGVGDVKILFKADTKNLRVLMRREQVHKICLNHRLTKDIEYKPKDDKSWLFHAADFSEGEIEHFTFCLRFKTEEIAGDFKKAIDAALRKANDESVCEEGDDTDLEIVFETKVTKEEEEEAKKLGLPPKFMSYRQLPDCTCKQCKKDDEYLKPTTVKSLLREKLAAPSVFNKMQSADKPTGPFSFVKSTGSVFGSPVTQPIFGQNSSTKSSVASTTSLFGTPESSSSVFGTPKTPASFFGTPNSSSGSPQVTTASIFGTSSASTTSVFGNVKTTVSVITTTAAPVFGSSAAPVSFRPPVLSTATPSGFATTASSMPFGTTTTSTVFGTTSTNTAFGTTTASSVFRTTPTNAVFGTTTSTVFGTTSTSTVFGTTTASSVFGTATTNAVFGTTTSTVFGTSKTPGAAAFSFGSISSNSGPTFASITTAQSGPVLGSGPIFGSAATPGKSIFGGKTTSADSPQVVSSAKPPGSEVNTQSQTPQNNTASSNFSFASLLQGGDKKGEVVSFSSLASGAASAGFMTENKSEKENPFLSLGAGAPVFGSYRQKEKNHDTSTENDEDEDYDPQFEPIIPLPDAINVTTGEEEEEVRFNERCKLYRYTNKEWKERGVGQIKVLYHPINKTYRLLHRRETVHKIVLNQLITPSLEINEFKMATNAWTWSGMNFLDNEMVPETLAVKFKNDLQSQMFYKAIQDAIADISAAHDRSIPTTIDYNYAEDEEDEDDLNEEEEEEGDYDEEEDERSILFNKKCSLSEQISTGEWIQVLDEGEFQIYYDPDSYASSISVIDDNGCIHCNTLIGANTIMERVPDENGLECKWAAYELTSKDSPYRHLKVRFDTVEDAQSCFLAYEEGVVIAKQSDIIDVKP